jgi:hypothetical protein
MWGMCSAGEKGLATKKSRDYGVSSDKMLLSKTGMKTWISQLLHFNQTKGYGNDKNTSMYLRTH